MRKRIQQRWENKWKLRGDLAVIVVPFMIGVVENAPNIKPEYAYWIIQTLSIVSLIAHFYAKTQQDKPTN